MNIRQLEYFLAVASELNFTRAAEKLYVSQTAVTKQIQSLEEQLGVELFERTKKKVVLTAAGNVFRQEASNLIDHWKTSIERVRLASNGVSGSLAVGFATGSGRTRIGQDMRDFVARYPSIGLTFENAAPSELLQMLRAGKVDVAFLPLFDERMYQEVEYLQVDEAGLVVVMQKSHALSYHGSIGRKDLEREHLILACSEDDALGEGLSIMAPFEMAGIHPHIVAKNENVETILFMVTANIGIAILPEYLGIQSEFRAQGELAEIPFEEGNASIRLIAAWNPENRNPSRQIMTDFLRAQL